MDPALPGYSYLSRDHVEEEIPYYPPFSIILAITVSDQVSVLLKNLTHRLRPCHTPAIMGIIHLVDGECGGLYSFVSSHTPQTHSMEPC